MTEQPSLSIKAPLPWQQSQWQQLFSQYERGQLAHAYLVYGEGGLGKKLFAAEFARSMLCLDCQQGIACGECANCLLGRSSSHPDIVTIEPDEGSRDIKIEQIRQLSEFVNRTSHAGSHKVVIINQAERLNLSAANALLKTLEEPSGDTYLLLVTDQPGSLMPTIRSRCQRLMISAPDLEDAKLWLTGKVVAGDEATLLCLAHNRPLLAIEYAGEGLLESRRDFLLKLGQILQDRCSIQSVVGVAKKIGESSVLGYLATTSSILIKYLLTNQRPQDADEEIDRLWSVLTSANLPSRPTTLRLMDLYAEIQQARRQLSGSTNPNPQLIMESLLWRWSNLLRGQADRV